jgi:hypothetical protein
VFDHGSETVAEQWRFATARESTADELAALLSNLLALRGLSFRDVSASIVSSTVPQLYDGWRAVAYRYLGHEALVVGPSLKTGMPIRTENPHEVGADRLVNSVAAYAKVRSTCVVVDFGTAITYDAVSADGEYLGGIITPGIEISIEALSKRAAARGDRALDGRGDPQWHRVRLRRSGGGHRPEAAGGTRRGHPSDRHRRLLNGHVSVHQAHDRRGRRGADAHGSAADLGAKPLIDAGRHGDVRRHRHRRRQL